MNGWGSWREGLAEALREEMTELFDEMAPGFKDLIIESFVNSPRDQENHNTSNVRGNMMGGSAIPEQAICYSADDPRVNEAMIVFMGMETEDDLLDHLEDLVTGDATGEEWLHVTLPTTFDKTMAPKGHTLARIESVVVYDPEWRSRSEAHGDACLETLKQFAEIDEQKVVIRRETTPVDIEEKLTTMTKGSYKRGAYTSLQLGYLRPNDQCSRSETPIDGLFIGGASMYPGGMILGATGYLAATVVGEYLEVPIQTCNS